MLFYFVVFMKQSLRYIGLLAILPLAMVALAPDYISEADAQKAERSTDQQSPKSYGSATDDVSDEKICEFLKLTPSECKKILQKDV